jgi:prolyl-tRNA synthetase
VATPGKKTIDEVSAFLGMPATASVKLLVLQADGAPVGVLLRGDHELNEIKLQRYLGCDVLEMATDEVVVKAAGAPVGYLGPVGTRLRIVADLTVQSLRNFVCGANEEGYHLKNVNLERDCTVTEFADLRNVTHGDPCPRCSDGTLEMWRGIEVGHVFKLGTKYSEALRATYLDADGKEQTIYMGCYGIGVGRTVAACIEQNHDADGIIFPIPIAPFHCVVSSVNPKEEPVARASEEIYGQLLAAGVEVLLDDRDDRPGVKFKDADLIGIPLRIVVGAKNLANGQVELKSRATGEVSLRTPAEAVEEVRRLVASSLAGGVL